MMSKKAIGAIVIIFLQFNITFAQNSFEVEGVYSVTAEKLVGDSPANLFIRQLFHSYGINAKKVFKSNFFLQGGVHFRNFGTKVSTEHMIIDDAASAMIGQSIDIPINVGYYFFNKNRVRLGASIGVNSGFLHNQYQDYYGFIMEEIPVYRDNLFHLNSSVEIGLKLTDHVILNIKPVFQRQINSNYGDYKQSGVGSQFGVSYVFK